MLPRPLVGLAFVLSSFIQSVSAAEISYSRDVQPIFTAKCVACHACYDSPCQLNLSSAEGAQRGANQLPVYDGTRTKAQETTRLYLDAHGADAWRRKGLLVGARIAGRPGRTDGADARAWPQPAVAAECEDPRRPGHFDQPRQPVPDAGQHRCVHPQEPRFRHAFRGGRAERRRIRHLAEVAGRGRPGRPAAVAADRRRGAPGGQLGAFPQPAWGQAEPGLALALRAPVPGAPVFPGAGRARPLLPAGAFAHAQRPADRPDPDPASQRRSGQQLLLPPLADSGRDRTQDAHHLSADGEEAGTRPGAVLRHPVEHRQGSRLRRAEPRQPVRHLCRDPATGALPVHAGQRRILHPYLHPRAGVPWTDRYRRDPRQLLGGIPGPRAGPVRHRRQLPRAERAAAGLAGADRRAEEPARPVERLPGQAQRVRRPAPGRLTPTRRRRPGTRSGTATTTPC